MYGEFIGMEESGLTIAQVAKLLDSAGKEVNLGKNHFVRYTIIFFVVICLLAVFLFVYFSMLENRIDF